MTEKKAALAATIPIKCHVGASGWSGACSLRPTIFKGRKCPRIISDLGPVLQVSDSWDEATDSHNRWAKVAVANGILVRREWQNGPSSNFGCQRPHALRDHASRSPVDLHAGPGGGHPGRVARRLRAGGRRPDRLYRPLKSELAARFPRAGSPTGARISVLAFRSWLRATSLRFIRLISHSTTFSAFRRPTGCRCGFITWHSRPPRTVTPAAWGSFRGERAGGAVVHFLRIPDDPFEPRAVLLPDALSAARLLAISERDLASGRIVWLALLALCLGLQWSVGHFQIQMWTGGLVVFFGFWRALAPGGHGAGRSD